MRGILGTGVAVACAMALLTTVGAAREARAESGQVVLARGDVVETPEIGALDCGTMRQVLREIDATNYRGIAPVAEGDPDYALFVYEDRLAAALYRRCTLAESRRLDPSRVFTASFEPR